MKKNLLLLFLICIVSLPGCKSSGPMPLYKNCPPSSNLPVLATSAAQVSPTPAAPPPAAPAPMPTVRTAGGLITAERIYPCNGCGVLKLQKTMPSSVQAGSEFEYRITLTNLTNYTISDVDVTDSLSDNYEYKSSNPPALIRGKTLVWIIPSLAAGETKEIIGDGIATGGLIQECTNVTYTMPLCMQTRGVLPVIVITAAAPEEISLCDLINYTVKVENKGTGSASNVRVIDQLPSGLLTPDGSGKVEIPVGDVPAGTAKDVIVSAKAYKTGAYSNCAVVVADGNISISSPPVTTVVKQAAFNLVQRGPENITSNEELNYQIALTNTGDYPAMNVIVENQIPRGATSIKVSRGGVVVEDKVLWKISKLNPGAMAKMAISYIPERSGIIVNNVKASAVCTDTAVSSFQTLVKELVGILLEMGDSNDPVKIGSDTTYKIVVTNQGSATDTAISIVATLEPQMQYVSSSGPTQGIINNQTITFVPLASLEPGASAVWQVKVKAIGEGDVRFTVRMTGDQLEREVMETESTHFYK